MADFKCEDGKYLSAEEVTTMLAYDDVGAPRPDAYDDVVFDATSIKGAAYRCRTEAEREAAEGAAKADAERAEARAKAQEVARKENQKRLAKLAGSADIATAPVNTGVRAVVNDAGPSGGDTASDTGARAGAGRARG
jgi:hypothetical protein